MLLEGGLLQEREARGYLEHIEKYMHGVSHCDEKRHPGELNQEERGRLLEAIEATLRNAENAEEEEATRLGSVEETSQPGVLGGLVHRRSSARDKFL
jgi:hypothetical protein